MAAPSGPGDSGLDRSQLEVALRNHPQEFEFFQAVHVLELLFPERQAVGRFVDPSTEVSRFRAHASLAFPASQIQSADWPEDAPVDMTVNFMGLTGPEGVLPLHYTMLLVERRRAGDMAMADFFDMFNHRLVSLFYQAWLKYRYTIAYESGDEDDFSHHLLDLIGLGTTGLQRRQDVRDESLLYFSGLLAQRPRSAAALEQLLWDYFEVPVKVEQFAGAWYRLDAQTQCQLEEDGGYSGRLGLGAVAGDEIWDQTSKVRIVMGPLTLEQYLDFLPEGSAFGPLRALTRFFANDQFDFEVQLILDRTQVPSCELGSQGQAAPRLGWVTWARTKSRASDATETILQL